MRNVDYASNTEIPFNKPPIIGTELNYIQEVIQSGKLCGGNYFTKRCEKWFKMNFQCLNVLLTPSCTASLEMAAILLDIKVGDEVIMPSFTFVSTANAFVLRGAVIVFIDIRPDTMNINENKIEAAITNKTRVIVPVHYGGISCEMDTIMTLAKKYNLYVVEDAAQGVMSTYKGKALGTIGHIGCYSFHETKNYSSGGEGGAIVINDSSLIDRAKIVREKGTNRTQFFQGKVSKYVWQDVGSSYFMSDLQAAHLWSQLEQAERINLRRLNIWKNYYQALEPLSRSNKLDLAAPPTNLQQNGHMFYIKLKDTRERITFKKYMQKVNILTEFHYVALHSSPAGYKFGRFHGDDYYTTKESERLVRLPMFYNLTDKEQQQVIKQVQYFYKNIS